MHTIKKNDIPKIVVENNNHKNTMIQIKQYSPTTTKIKAVVYGASGIGKTSFAGEAKNVIFASAEGGLLSIADKLPNYVEIKSLQDLKDFYKYLKTTPHNFDSVVIDSITEINEIIKLDIEKKNGRAMQLQDWGTLSKEIKNILRSFRDLAEEPKETDAVKHKAINVLFIAQELYEDKDENGAASKIVPSLNGKASTDIAYFMDIVGYMIVDKAGQRKIITSSNPKLLTKDRTKLIGNDTEVSFQAWIDKVKDMKISTEEKVVESVSSESVDQVENQTTAKPVSKFMSDTEFDSAKVNVKKLTSIPTLIDNYKKIDGATRLSPDQKIELKNLIQKIILKLDPQYLDNDNVLSPFPPTEVPEEK